MPDVISSRCSGPLKRNTLCVLLLACLGARAGIGTLEIEHAWAPPNPPGTTVAVVYLRLRNNGTVADRLMTVDSSRAEHIALHQSHIVGGVLQMREVDSVECPPGAVLDSASGGMHLMLMGVKQSLKAGSQFPLSLHFRDAGTIVVSVAVKAEQ